MKCGNHYTDKHRTTISRRATILEFLDTGVFFHGCSWNRSNTKVNTGYTIGCMWQHMCNWQSQSSVVQCTDRLMYHYMKISISANCIFFHNVVTTNSSKHARLLLKRKSSHYCRKRYFCMSQHIQGKSKVSDQPKWRMFPYLSFACNDLKVATKFVKQKYSEVAISSSNMYPSESVNFYTPNKNKTCL